MHRVVWFLGYDEWPEAYINHEDRDPSNNCLSNLTKESHEANSQWRGISSNNSSGVNGVSWVETRGYLYANAFYRQEGKAYNKRFSVLRYGKEEAWRLAVEFRQTKIHELNRAGGKFEEESNELQHGICCK